MKWQELPKSPIWAHLQRLAERFDKLPQVPDSFSLRLSAVPNIPMNGSLWSYLHERAEQIEQILEHAHEYCMWLEEHQEEYKEKEVRAVFNEYRLKIERRYDISVEFDKYFNECFGEMPISEFLEMLLDEDFLLGRLIAYAKDREKDFDRLCEEMAKPVKVKPGRPKAAKQVPQQFEELFESSGERAFVERMLKEQHFYRGNIVLLGKKDLFKIPAICDALKVKGIVPNLSDAVLHKLFADKIGVEYKKWDRRADDFGLYRSLYFKYIEKEYPPKPTKPH